MMDPLMADGRKLTKIIKTAKWGKSHPKKYKKYLLGEAKNDITMA